MRCLHCHYDLRNLTEHRCPECGRAFDPSDSTTYIGRPDIRAWKLWYFLNYKLRGDWVPAYWLILFILVFVLYLVRHLF